MQQTEVSMSKVRVLLVAMLMASPVAANAGTPQEEVRALFERWIAAQNAHDLKGVGDVLSGSPNTVFLNGAGTILWGRDEIVKYFAGVHKANVKMEPDFAGWRIVMQTDNAAHFFVPVKVTLAPPGQDARTFGNWMNGIVVKEGDRWSMIGGLPIPDRAR
jgi:uncharacterized protein (TIGR02246 family)